MVSQLKSSQEKFTNTVEDLKPIIFDESLDIESRLEKLSEVKKSVSEL